MKDKKNEGLPHRTDNGTFRQAVERAVELTSDRAALDFSTLDIVEESKSVQLVRLFTEKHCVGVMEFLSHFPGKLFVGMLMECCDEAIQKSDGF